MNQVKTQVIQKLNAIVELVRHCATKALPTQDQNLMQEVTLAVASHEGLCKLFEEEGATEKVVSLVNEFGRAIVELYHNIEDFNPVTHHATATGARTKPYFSAKRPSKNLLN